MAGLLLVALGLYEILHPVALSRTLLAILVATIGVSLLWRFLPDGTGAMVFSADPLRVGMDANPAGGKRRPAILALLVLGLAGTSYLWMQSERIALAMFGYAMSAGLLMFLERRSRAFSRSPGAAGNPLEWNPLSVAAILAFGGWFAFYRLSLWPDWIQNDGAMSLRAALAFRDGYFKTPFFTEWGDNPTLPFLLYAGAFRLFEVELFTAAWVPALIHVATLPLFYGWVRFFLPDPTAWAVSLGYAVSRWTLFFVRTPRESSLLPAFEVAALYFATAAVETGRKRDFALAALFLALCLHTYLPSRAVLAFFLYASLVLVLLRPSLRAIQGLQWLGALGLGVCAMTPLLVWYAKHPATLFNRIREVNVLKFVESRGDPGILWDQVRETCLMFDVRGIPDPHFNIDLLPLLGPGTGVALGVGFFWCLWRIGRDLSPVPLVLAGGFCLTLLTTLLAVPPGHPMRAIVNAPFAFAIAGIGLDRLARSLASIFPIRTHRALLGFVLGLWVAGSVAWNADVYFRRMPADRGLWGWNEGSLVLAGRILAAQEPGNVLYATRPYAGSHHVAVLAHGRRVKVLDPGQALPPAREEGLPVVVLLNKDQDESILGALRALHPGLRVRDIPNRFGEVVFRLVELSPPSPTERKDVR